MGQKIVPSSCTNTSGEPGLLMSLVKAQAESITQPVTVFCPLSGVAANSPVERINAAAMLVFIPAVQHKFADKYDLSNCS